MTAIAEKKPRRKATQPVVPAIPAALIYEMWNGKPVYYKGYRGVLTGKKTVEEVMRSAAQSCSGMQGVMVSLIHGHLFAIINRKRYLLATNEIGVHLALNSNLANDVLIYEKEKVGKLKGKFFDVPPKVVIEIDIKADAAEFDNGADGYLMEKARKLLDFGVEKVLWVITSAQKTYVINKNDATWYVVDWSEDITILDGCILNIKQLLDEDEIEY